MSFMKFFTGKFLLAMNQQIVERTVQRSVTQCICNIILLFRIYAVHYRHTVDDIIITWIYEAHDEYIM